MWIHQRTSRNMAISYPLWPLVFIAFATILGASVFVGRYPWVSLAVLIALILGALVRFEDTQGRWPWQSRSNPEFDLDPESQGSDEFVTTILKPYRDQIHDTEH